MTREEAHQLVDQLFSAELHDVDVNEAMAAMRDAEDVLPPTKVLPEGIRMVRTKTSGDRVYMLDEEKKTKQWVTTPEVLASYGFDPTDVVDIDEDELMRYNVAAALYKPKENE